MMKDILKLMRKRFDASVKNEHDERKKGLEDIKFINGEQWEDAVIKERGKNRLAITINKMPQFLDQIEGDMRIAKPGIRIRAFDDNADPETADKIEGKIRYIQQNSSADRIHAYAGVHAAAGGRGAWRIVTDWVNDTSFDQEIKLERIVNPYSVYFDPAAQQDDKQDGDYIFIVTEMSKDEYKDEYGFEPVDFSVDGEALKNWGVGDKVRIAEYFYKKKTGTKTLYLLNDGSLATKEPKEYVRKREVETYKIKWAKVDGKRVLDEEDFPGKMFPIVLTWGKQLCVDGKLETRGIARHSKDAQRLYNYFRTTDAEAAALQPKQPYLIPDVALGDYQNLWDKANDKNLPYLPYHVDPNYPNLGPHRESPAMASSGNEAQIRISDEEMHDTVGIQRAGLGQPSNEKSGVAIQRRKQESDTGQYAYLDNLAEAIKTEVKIILSMIPEIYDTERQIRILGKDSSEKTITINDGEVDFTKGKYVVDVSPDASYSTQREEFQQMFGLILPHLQPEQVTLVSDIFFEMQDFPRAQDIAKRLKKLIPPQFLEGDESGQTMTPGEGGAPGQPAPEGQSPEQPGIPPQSQGIPQEAGQPPMGQAVQGQPAQPPVDQAQQQAADIELQLAQVKLQQEQEKLNALKIENEIKLKTNKEEIRKIIAEMMGPPAKGGK